MRRGDGPTLAERSQRASAPTESSAGPTKPDTPVDVARLRPVGQRHRWVTDPNASGQRFAGLVISWAATPEGGWSGRTIYVVDDQQPPVVIEAWVPAEHLQPA